MYTTLFNYIKYIVSQTNVTKLIGLLVIELVIKSFVLTKLYRAFTGSINDNDVDTAVTFMIAHILLGSLFYVFREFIIKREQTKYYVQVHTILEKDQMKRFTSLDWSDIKNVPINEIDLLKNEVIFNTKQTIKQMIDTVLQLFSLINPFIMIIQIVPLSGIMYVCAFVYLCMTEKEKKNKQKLESNWDQIWFAKQNMYTNMIHHNGQQTVDDIVTNVEIIESSQDLNRFKFTQIIFSVISILNLLSYRNRVTKATDLLLLVMYNNQIKMNIQFVTQMRSCYDEATKKFDKFIEFFKTKKQKKEYKQMQITTKLEIQDLTYQVGTNFCLQLQSPVNIKSGEIIMLSGDSGHGKSTFLDVVSGIVDNDNYSCTLEIDNHCAPNKFNNTEKERVYISQTESISFEPSVYTIVTGDHKMNGEHDYLTIQKALSFANCDDFMSKRDLYTPVKNRLSGGQKARLQLARSFYNIIVHQPKIVILDEVDKCIQSKTVKQIMTDIFAYCRKQNMICLVVAHTTELKNLKYDQVLYFKNGSITTESEPGSY